MISGFWALIFVDLWRYLRSRPAIIYNSLRSHQKHPHHNQAESDDKDNPRSGYDVPYKGLSSLSISSSVVPHKKSKNADTKWVSHDFFDSLSTDK